SDLDPWAVPGDFEVTIFWGDGTPASTGTIEATLNLTAARTPGAVPPNSGPFLIWGAHTYRTAGVYPIVILVSGADGGDIVTLTGTTATITDNNVVLQRLPGTRLEVGADASADGGQATLAPNTGTLQVFQPFDFRQSHDPSRDGFIDVNGNPL